MEQIDSELKELAEFLVQEDVGYVRERDAWIRVDELLDLRNEVGRTAVGLVTVEAINGLL